MSVQMAPKATSCDSQGVGQEWIPMARVCIYLRHNAKSL